MFVGWTRSFICAALALGNISAPAQDPVNISPRAGLEMFSSFQASARSGLATNPPAKTRRGLEAIDWLAGRARTIAKTSERAALARQIAEVNAALENNRRSPVPHRIDLLQLPFVHYRYISGRVGMGLAPA